MSDCNSKIRIAIRFVALLVVSAALPWLAHAQTYRMVTPPPATLQVPAFNQPIYGAPFCDSGPDAFAQPINDNAKLHPWHTVGIPPGSWGNSNMWTPQQLNSTTIERFRKSFVQNVDLNGGYIARDGLNDLGYSWASAAITMVVPLGGLTNVDNLLVFTPSYRTDWVDGPADIDVPAQLHSTSLVIGWRRVFNPKWTVIAGVQPGIYNDRDSIDDGFRLTGLAIANYQMIPDQLTLSFGIVYTGRNDVNLIPGVGLTWIPEPNTRFDLNFPKPKIGRRVSHIPYVLEDWVYLHGSFGGGEWAVRRTSGIDDELSLRDYRVGVGFERILNGGTGFNLDIGYVFGRELEYLSNGLQKSLDESFLIEAGMRF